MPNSDTLQSFWVGNSDLLIATKEEQIIWQITLRHKEDVHLLHVSFSRPSPPGTYRIKPRCFKERLGVNQNRRDLSSENIWARRQEVRGQVSDPAAPRRRRPQSRLCSWRHLIRTAVARRQTLAHTTTYLVLRSWSLLFCFVDTRLRASLISWQIGAPATGIHTARPFAF